MKTLLPNFVCQNCNSEWTSILDMSFCPACKSTNLIYQGEPRYGIELEVPRFATPDNPLKELACLIRKGDRSTLLEMGHPPEKVDRWLQIAGTKNRMEE